MTQHVQVHYRHATTGRSYAYRWEGKERLRPNDIVVLPGTTINPGQYVLGVVSDETSDYTGERAPILYAVRGRFLK